MVFIHVIVHVHNKQSHSQLRSSAFLFFDFYTSQRVCLSTLSRSFFAPCSQYASVREFLYMEGFNFTRERAKRNPDQCYLGEPGSKKTVACTSISSVLITRTT